MIKLPKLLARRELVLNRLLISGMLFTFVVAIVLSDYFNMFVAFFPSFFFAGLLWLSSREIELSYERVHRSEQALKEERDLLEKKVEERTRELKQLQLEKILQLYRFAELGKISSGLFHDLTNPLTAVSLNLEGIKPHKDDLLAVKRALQSLRQMEEFILAARKQIQKQELSSRFSLSREIQHSIQVLSYKAKKKQVKMKSEVDRELILFGNSLKFNQVITNLLSNAIDAYQDNRESEFSDKSVVIQSKKSEEGIVVSIHDDGCGIPRSIRAQVFEPLFTTKKPELGMGIGLSISKQIIQEDFHGSISFRSEEGVGTTFFIFLPVTT